jgi:hypothetical protein
LFDLPPGDYAVEITALDKAGKVAAVRRLKIVHGNGQPGK